MFRACASLVARNARRTAVREHKRFMSSGASVEEEIGASRARMRAREHARAHTCERPRTASWRYNCAFDDDATDGVRAPSHAWVTDIMFSRSVARDCRFAAEMNKWRAVSAIAIPACAGFGVYTLANAEHPHAQDTAYSYLKIRNREQFPWGGDCGLFEHRDDCK